MKGAIGPLEWHSWVVKMLGFDRNASQARQELPAIVSTIPIAWKMAVLLAVNFCVPSSGLSSSFCMLPMQAAFAQDCTRAQTICRETEQLG